MSFSNLLKFADRPSEDVYYYMNDELPINREYLNLSSIQSLPGGNELDQWLFQYIRRFLKGKVLELGSNTGNISAPIDLGHERFTTEYAPYLEQFDTLVSLQPGKFNFSDPRIWHNAKALLRERGRLLILLPAPAVPFEESAEGLGIWYRWTRRQILNLLGTDGEMIQIQSFRISNAPRSPDTEMTDALPFFPASEGTFFSHVGLYIVVAARKL